eukprot:UN26396
MKGLAFALDPDGYWVEIVSRGDKKGTIKNYYNFSQTMIRIKDPKKSLPFYQDMFGMTLLHEKHFPDKGKFSLYFLATLQEGQKPPKDTKEAGRDMVKGNFGPVLELTHNHGTENEKDFAHYHGNEENRKGFGHIGFLVDDVYEKCK